MLKYLATVWCLGASSFQKETLWSESFQKVTLWFVVMS